MKTESTEAEKAEEIGGSFTLTETGPGGEQITHGPYDYDAEIPLDDLFAKGDYEAIVEDRMTTAAENRGDGPDLYR